MLSDSEKIEVGLVSIGERGYVFGIRDNNNIYIMKPLQGEQEAEIAPIAGESGIGPKVALGILSSISPYELSSAIRTEDFSRLTKLPGIGKKTAERICLELKDKMPFVPEEMDNPLQKPEKTSDNQQVADTVSALVNLGINRTNAENAVQKVIQDTPEASFEELVRQALRLVA